MTQGIPHFNPQVNYPPNTFLPYNNYVGYGPLPTRPFGSVGQAGLVGQVGLAGQAGLVGQAGQFVRPMGTSHFKTNQIRPLSNRSFINPYIQKALDNKEINGIDYRSMPINSAMSVQQSLAMQDQFAKNYNNGVAPPLIKINPQKLANSGRYESYIGQTKQQTNRK